MRALVFILSLLVANAAHARCGDALFNAGEACDDGDVGGFVQSFAVDAAYGPLLGLARVPDIAGGETRFLAGDPTRDRVIALGADGELVGTFATLANAGIGDVLVGGDGVVYVASLTTDRVDRFLVTTGQSIGAFPLGGGIVDPQALAIQGSFIYVASSSDGPIQRIGLNGTLIGPFGNARGERDLAFDDSGNLFTIRGATIVRWSASGADLGVFASVSEVSRLNTIAFADDATLYALGETGGGAAVLVRYAANGTKLGTSSGGGLAATVLVGDAASLMVGMRQGGNVGIGRFLRGNSNDARDACRLDCRAARCGDRVIDTGERCDDGNGQSGDGCSACVIDPGYVCGAIGCVRSCGDGSLDEDEGCDDGGILVGDGCDANCAVEPGWVCLGPVCDAARCGDRIQAGDETCDDGNTESGDGCDAGCQVEGCADCPDTCGDGVVDSDEGCDDGGVGAGDGCDVGCEVEPGWTCSGARSVCRAARCGDGIAVGAEACDDGNGATDDGCDACRLEPGWVCPGECARTCGDGVVQAGEGCDDGTIAGGDGCDPSCRIELGWTCPTSGGACVAARCGDGVAAGGEACDDGNGVVGDGCGACQIESGWVCDLAGCRDTCGDGVVESGEECDLGDLRSGDGCDATCRREAGWFCDAVSCEAICGDLQLVGDESCDDLNDSAGDGCNGCVIEAGWACGGELGEPSACAATCGDGVSDANEACDDHGVASGDGCDPSCRVETGWTCDELGCLATCGDRRVVGMEGCDDGNSVGFDGCDRCVREAGWVCDLAGCRETCGNGAVEAAEPCDDGDLEDGDGCDVLCDVEPGWVCAGVPSTCDAASCGDGILAGFEDCDDGANAAGDGCDAFCAAEVGWTCAKNVCAAICGDGRWLGGEACDDGNRLAGDGCTSCGIESGWTCVGVRGGVSGCRLSEECGDGDAGGDEACDDGNDVRGDGCTPACEVEEGWVCGPDVLDDGPGCAEIDDDGDGLSNLAELALGTRVDESDTDDDGVEDGDEVAAKTDPKNPDSDGDGLLDGEERRRGLDPLRSDSDGDGVSDRIDNCPLLPNANQRDIDKDGLGSVCDADELAGAVVSGGECGGGVGSGVGLNGGLIGGLIALVLLRRGRRVSCASR